MISNEDWQQNVWQQNADQIFHSAANHSVANFIHHYAHLSLAPTNVDL
jgi:hypothetical protein